MGMISYMDQNEKALAFLKLHHDSHILILPNVWDVLSTKLCEMLGFKAIGTTSAGIAAATGFPDGQKMSLYDNLRTVKIIAENTGLPVSADIEAGYSKETEEVVKAALAAVQAGAVGINLEDSTGDDMNPLFRTVDQIKKIRAIRRMFDNNDIHPVINLRTDVYLSAKTDLKSRYRDTVRRANAYLEAGGDCIFVPDMGDLDVKAIRGLVKEIPGPLNIIAGQGKPSIPELEEMGVARISFGPRPMRAAYGYFKKIMAEILISGNYDSMTAFSLTYSEVNAMFGNSEDVHLS